jgi:hypothetical protein
MKKRIGVLLLLIFVAGFASAQKSNKYGKSRKDFFGGAEDYRDISKNGLQISFGVNYTLAPKNLSYSGVDANLGNRPYDATVDPSGKPGGFIDIGMAHYRLKPSKVLGAIYKLRKDNKPIKFIGSNLIHRIDWGIGFDYIGGAEKTIVNYPTFNLTNEEKGSFYNGYLYGRITADRFTQLNDKWHLETGLGLNFNYNILPAPKTPYSVPSAPLRFQKDFMTQLHGHIGFNYKIRRGDYLIFGFYLPAIGFYEWNKAKPTIQWYSSNYYPLHLQVKWIHHFTKKSNGCNTGSPEDRKRNQEYMQNR